MAMRLRKLGNRARQAIFGAILDMLEAAERAVGRARFWVLWCLSRNDQKAVIVRRLVELMATPRADGREGIR